jgi:type I restriction enzyme, S subunit
LRHLLRRGFANGIFKKKEDYGRGALLVNVADLYSPNAVVDDSKLERVEVTTDELATFGVHEGDVFFVRSSLKLDGIAVAARAGAAQEPRVFECHVVGVRPDTGRIDPRFLTYQLNAEPVRSSTVSRATTTTMTTISQDHLADIRVWCPPLELQRRIADYLDAEVSRIDALTGGKQRVLDLLAEKRKAIIATAVTRGLAPKVKLRDSGVPWLGEIPAHWRSTRVGRLFRQSKILDYPDLTVLSVYREFGVIERASRDDNSNRVPDDLSKYQLVEVGDLVVNKMKAWQGSLGISDFRGITSPDYVVFRPIHSEEPRFLHSMLRMPQLTTVYLSISNGIRINQWRIEPERFANVEVFLPPLDEQRAIVEHIARESAKLDSVRAATERTIALLKERRSALIAAAVTGQLDLTTKEGAAA